MVRFNTERLYLQIILMWKRKISGNCTTTCLIILTKNSQVKECLFRWKISQILCCCWFEGWTFSIVTMLKWDHSCSKLLRQNLYKTTRSNLIYHQSSTPSTLPGCKSSMHSYSDKTSTKTVICSPFNRQCTLLKIDSSTNNQKILNTTQKPPKTYADIVIGYPIAWRFPTNFQKDGSIRHSEVVKKLIIPLLKLMVILQIPKQTLHSMPILQNQFHISLKPLNFIQNLSFKRVTQSHINIISIFN